MMSYFNFNGKLYAASTPVIGPDNRGLRYGDGLFETIKCINGEIILCDEHMQRLWKGMEKLQFEPPKLFTPLYLSHQIHLLLQKNKNKDARIRLSIVRGEGGLFDPINHQPNYIIQSWPLQNNYSAINQNGLQLCIFKDAKKQIDFFSNIKHNNFLPYSMAALHAKTRKCNDAIVLNSQNRICETSIANIFLVMGKEIITPPLSEACIAGIMRSFIVRQLKKIDFDVKEKPVKLSDLTGADEIFLTNSMYNMRWVSSVEGINYSNAITSEIFTLLQKTNPLIFC